MVGLLDFLVDFGVCVVDVFWDVLLADVVLVEPLFNSDQVLHALGEVFLLLVYVLRGDDVC